jgi:hypothetical protein
VWKKELFVVVVVFVKDAWGSEGFGNSSLIIYFDRANNNPASESQPAGEVNKVNNLVLWSLNRPFS